MCSRKTKRFNFQPPEDFDSYKFFVLGGVLKITHGETVLRMERNMVILYLIALMIRDRTHRRGSRIASGGEKKSYKGIW